MGLLLWSFFRVRTQLQLSSMRFTFSTLVLELLLILATFAACQIAPPSNQSISISLDGRQLQKSLAHVEEWPNGIQINSQYAWDQLIAVAKVIQKNDPGAVEKALLQYQMTGCVHGDFQAVDVLQEKNDTKLFLLMRAVFKLPEAVPAKELREFGGWIPTKSVINEDGTANQDWPIKWDQGHPKLTSGFIGLQGINARYNAVEEYKYFLSKYSMRDLSSFPEQISSH